MSDIVNHFLDAAIAILIIFLVPLIYFGQKQDALVQTLVYTETNSLVSEIRSNGYLTRDRYDLFLENLSDTGLLYDISMEHRHEVHEPEYRLRTAQEVIDEQNSTYTGSNVYTYRPVTTDIPVVSDPVNTGALNTETNASVLASAVNTPASAGHVHTDSCYNGTKHVHIGNATSGGGCYGTYQAHQHISSCYTTSYCDGTWTGGYATTYRMYFNCSFCGKSTGGWAETTTTSGTPSPHVWTCSYCWKRNSTPFSIVSVSSDWYGHCTKCPAGITSSMNMQGVSHGTTTSLNCSRTGEYTLNCGKTEGAYYNGNTQVFPICSQLITSIIATHTVQTVAIGDPLITTCTASYLDGSTKVIVGTTSFSTSSPVQNQTVTITYNYMIGETSYSKSCNITVTVIPRSKTCAKGHLYNLNSDGSDPGCPYCRSWLASLVITYPSTGSLTIYRGTTLSENGVTLLATYLDGHTQLLTNQYVDNLDSVYVGTQNVTISYKGKYVYLTVVTKRNLKQCSVCNRNYELYPDGSDPGCPFCKARTPIFTGNVLEYYNENYTNEILKELYEGEGIYYFTNKDCLVINVQNNSRSWGQKLLSFIYRGLWESNIQTISDGYIREDGNPYR